MINSASEYICKALQPHVVLQVGYIAISTTSRMLQLNLYFHCYPMLGRASLYNQQMKCILWWVFILDVCMTKDKLCLLDG